MTVKINGTTYEMACTLRVAYMVQGQHNHKPYSKVFSELGDMVLEDQVGILYCAFKAANPNFNMSREEFFNYYLDNISMKEVMEQIKEVIQGVMGVDDSESPAPAKN